MAVCKLVEMELMFVGTHCGIINRLAEVVTSCCLFQGSSVFVVP
jgi:hypothetical protein